MATYYSKAMGLTVTLRSVGKQVINGEVVPIRGLRAEFNHGVFRTDNEEIIKGLDRLLSPEHPRSSYWSHKFQKEPSEAVKAEARRIAAKVESAKQKAVEEVMKKEKSVDRADKAVAAKTEVTDFEKFLRDRKGNNFTVPKKEGPEIVTGARDVGVLR